MFDLILDSVKDFHTVEERRLHRIFCGLSECDLVFAFTDLHELHKWRLDYE